MLDYYLVKKLVEYSDVFEVVLVGLKGMVYEVNILVWFNDCIFKVSDVFNEVIMNKIVGFVFVILVVVKVSEVKVFE